MLYFLWAWRDLVFKFLPASLIRALIGRADFCFLVHPRDMKDVFNHFPFLRVLPKKMVRWLLAKFLWPLIGPKITGLKFEGRPFVGRVIFSPLLAEQLVFRQKNHVSEKLLSAAKLAEKLNAKIIGLGGFTAAASRYGQDLSGKIKPLVTTGHGYTAYAVVEITRQAADIVGLDLKQATVAIVGASGSMGSACTRLLDSGELVKELLLVEKANKLTSLQNIFAQTNNKVSFTSDLTELRRADLIITLTNAVSNIIEASHLKSGAIVVDDAQPINISRDLINIDGEVLIMGCAIHAPGIKCDYNFGLPRDVIFTCLGETLAICVAQEEAKELCTVGQVNIDRAREVAKRVTELGFYPVLIDNEGRPITYYHLSKSKKMHNQK